jgi:lipid II:glycine glycyltransferase (peptidoglycan interpeptide bridge formation enzyme)
MNLKQNLGERFTELTHAEQPSDSSFSSKRVKAADFDLMIETFEGNVLEMTVAFASARWPLVALEPWVFSDADKPVAAAIVMVQSLPLRTGKLAILKWGPFFASETEPLNRKYYALSIEHLKAEYAVKRRMMLSVMPRAERDTSLQAVAYLLKQGFRCGDGMLFPDRYLVNLRLSDDEQRKSFSQKWRYHLSKSEKSNLVFDVAKANEFPRFDKLYQAMSDRKNFPDYSAYSTVESLFASDAKSVQPQLFFVTHEGQDIAGAIIYKSGKTAVYLYGATNDRALPLRAGYFMHGRIISWLRDQTKADWYDLGGTDGFAGLHQFKKGMVGSAGIIAAMPPIINYAHYPRAYAAGHIAYAARRLFQNTRKHWVNLTAPKAKPDQDLKV